MESKTRKIIRILVISVITLIALLMINNKSIAADYDSIQDVKDAYSYSNRFSQINKTKGLNLNSLKTATTVWCIEKGQELSAQRIYDYSIETIINIGNKIDDSENVSHKLSSAVAYRKTKTGNNVTAKSPNNSDKGDNKSEKERKNARLAYIIWSGHDNKYNYNDGYETFGPQIALWAFFDDWKSVNVKKDGGTSNLLREDDWNYSYSASTIQELEKADEITTKGIKDAKQILADSYVYANLITNSNHGYNKNGKMTATKNSASVVSSNGKYYAGPFALNFSYYDASSSNYTYIDRATTKTIGLLESIKIDGNNVDVTKQVGGDKVQIKNIKSDDDFYIILDSLPSDKVTLNVTVKQSEYNLISARLWFMQYKYEDADPQHLLITESNANTIKGEEVTANLEIKLPTNVSLQKYITKVTDKLGGTTYNNTTARQNKYAETGSLVNDLTDKTKTHQGYNISKNNNVSGTTSYKKDNYVEIEAGDTVQYTITVYNNSTVPAKVKIRDRIIKDGTITSITSGSNRITWQEYTNDASSSDYKYYRILVDGDTEFSLAGNASRTFLVSVIYNTYTTNLISNKAWISSTTPDNKQDYRTIDADYVKMKPYKVSLQKIVYSVNGNTSGITSFDRWSSWESNENKANKNANTYKKHNNPVTVASGDYVTYAIKVRNDGETIVRSLKIKDILPQGLSEYKQGVYSSSGTYTARPNNGEITLNVNRQLISGQEFVIYITAKVSESNMSTRVLQNKAEILNNQITNKNNVTVQDTTPNNNQDADYIQLKDITIAGTVWNDKALDKKQDNYNGVYDEGPENKLSGIKVMLYREGKGVIATTTTDENGNYSFDASKIDSSVVTEQCERHIKAPYTCTSSYSGSVRHGSNYWKENSYYAYYVVFEYDGITYTSTTFADVTSNNDKDSNAKEDNGQVEEARKHFNDRFSTINRQSGIEYTTKNESDSIPQSNHVYNEETMAMQSSTNRIKLSNTASLEQQLTHVNLGLRGRDVFDLNLSSDVYSTKVTVNGQDGTYNYNSNKVTVRKSDISVAEDAANFASETREATVGEIGQAVRTTDLDVGAANNGATNPYTSTGLGIEVTYKITVTNESQTVGTASRVIDYYDSRYTFERAYIGDTTLSTEAGETGTGFKSVIITTTGSQLTQSDTMDIYVVYRLNEPTTTLSALLSGTPRIPTYNMAEVYEYKTYTTDNNEATRGLLDKDSAPGSANTETVRLANGSSDETTVRYYFNAQNLSDLKYEDDTYAAPTLYFTKDDNGRTLSGVVFRDSTTTDEETRIKTGNGIQDDGEVGVYGATVELVEISNPGDAKGIAEDAGTIRYTLTTDENGNYTFSNFLPGNYVIRYHYGDKTETVLLHQHESGVNNYSYNGEDYQATNNIGAYGAEVLNNTANIWYAYNEKEGVSTGTDNEARRSDVTDNVTNFTDEEMTVLNNVRDGEEIEEAEQNSLIAQTYMFSTTPVFTLSVEKTETDANNENPTQKDAFSDYHIQNMNFGVAEVPVTTIDLQKHIQSFTIKDSAGENTIASLTKNEDGEWVTMGDVLPSGNLFDVSIEDEKLQGARLEVTYNVTISMTTEKDFTNRDVTIPTIEGIADFVDNDLSYNESLGENSKYWELTTHDDIKAYLADSQYKEGSLPQGTVDSESTGYTTVLKAKEGNPILLKETGTASCPITLEKVLSSEEVTVGDIITSSINTYEYDNTVEITKLDYGNAKSEDGSIIFRDRVRTPSRYIILAGTQHDSAISETIAIHPPTGTNNSITYYIIGVISLGILAIGIVLIKKYAIKGKDEK